VFFVLIVAIALREVAAREPVRPAYRAALLFGAAATLGSALGFEPLSGLIAAAGFVSLAVGASAIDRVAAGGAWRPILTAFLWSGIFFCALAIVPEVLRRPAALYAFAHGRAIGIFENPNELAEYTLAVAAAGIGAALGDERLRPLGWVSAGVATLTLFATGSRSGEIAFAIGALVLLAGLRPRRGIAALVLAVAVAGLAAGFVLDRRHNPAETDSRLAAWSAGVRTVALFPLTGVGIGAYYRLYPAVRGRDAPGLGDPIAYDPHNFYLSVASETGLLGLGTMGYMIACLVVTLRATLAGAAPAQRRLSLAMGAGLAALACHLIFNGFALSIAIWAVLSALAFGIPRSEEGRAL
jgi:O-antigen ligase